MHRLGSLRLALVAGLVPVLFVGVAAPASLATFTSAARVQSNTLTAGYWTTYFLHDKPSPPQADNKANPHDQMAMNSVAPSATRLYNYSDTCTVASGTAGRALEPNGLCGEADWRSDVLTRATGTRALLRIWTQGAAVTFTVNVRQGNSGGAIRGTATVNFGSEATWTRHDIPITLGQGIPVGSRISLEVDGVVGVSARLAYDTTLYQSFLSLP